MKSISQKRLITRHIILLSPDHFSNDQHQITTSNFDWNLSTGVFKHSSNLNLKVDNQLIQNDHGIYNPLADLKKFFPKADVTPVLIGQKVSPDQLQALADSIDQLCKLDCLLVASVDFSHYLPATMAEVHDVFTIKQLTNLDLENIFQSEVDSPQSLYLILKTALLRNATKFNLFAHTNSGIIAKDPSIETTTHIFGSFSKGSSPLNTDITVVHLPHKLTRSENQKTLGDRFFYGVDKIFVDSSYPKFIVATIQTSQKLTKIFLPIDNNNFVIGDRKQQMIKELFDSIKETTVTKDYFWGKLIYEQ